jgi:ketosteroid isomerase-like protein
MRHRPSSEAIDNFRTEPFEFLDAGDEVVAGLIHRGRGEGSSAAVEMREWNVFVIREEKIVSVHEYRDREEALEAAGLDQLRIDFR